MKTVSCLRYEQQYKEASAKFKDRSLGSSRARVCECVCVCMYLYLDAAFLPATLLFRIPITHHITSHHSGCRACPLPSKNVCVCVPSRELCTVRCGRVPVGVFVVSHFVQRLPANQPHPPTLNKYIV